jgi:O-antigen/teichoic acid export membrane protein
MLKASRFGLLSTSVLYGLGGAAQRLIGFILLPIFTRYLTPADYGIVGLLVILPALLLPVFSLGLSASISVCYFAKEHPSDRQSVIQTARLVTYASVSLMMIMAMIAIDLVTRLTVGNLEYRLHTLVAVVTVVFNVLCLPLQLEQQFSGRPLEFVKISIASAVCTALASVLAIVAFELGALGMLLGNLLGQVVVWVLLLVMRQKAGIESNGRPDFVIARDLVTHGVPMLPSFLLLFVIQSGVRWPLEWSHGVNAVGLYSVGASFGSTLTLLTSGFVAAWIPWAMRHGERWEEGRQVVATRFTQYLIGGGFLVLLFFCVSQPALRILTPPSYFDAWVVVGLAAAANFLMSLFSLLLPPIYMAKKVSLVLISQAGAALVTAGVFYMLLDFGILGAALAVSIGSLSLVVIQAVVNAKLTDIQPIPLDGPKLARVVLVLLVTCWATFWLQISDIGNFFLSSFLLVLFAGIVLFRCFPDKQALLKKFSRGSS